MIKPKNHDVRVFLNQDALHLVLAMPSGEDKEIVAKPASTLEPCEEFVRFTNGDDVYYFLFVIPTSRDVRLLIASKTLASLHHYIYDNNGLMNDVLKERVLTKFTEFLFKIEDGDF